MSSPTVRVASPSDAARIAEAHVRSWQVAYEGIIDQATLDRLDVDDRTARWEEIPRGEHTVDGVENPTNYVAELDSTVVGFACVGGYRDDPTASLGELWALYVHPDHWRSGSGTALMGATKQYFDDRGLDGGRLYGSYSRTRSGDRSMRSMGGPCSRKPRPNPSTTRSAANRSLPWNTSSTPEASKM